MSTHLRTAYPHLPFEVNWDYTQELLFLLAKCEQLLESLRELPMLPETREALLHVSLIRGARSTTAIEGNTLTQEEVERILANQQLPRSKEYQAVEVRNILSAFRSIWDELIEGNRPQKITPTLLKDLHRKVAQGLGEHIDAVPGRFRETQAVVGRYRCPAPEDVPALVDNLCAWMAQEFRFGKEAAQPYWQVIVQAVVAHVYLELIHPFGDGNGRTGRLLEFYVLLRGGLPDLATHILSNHYNETRSEYYRQLEQATKQRKLTDFLRYALQGFYDGLTQTFELVGKALVEITWQRFVYDTYERNTTLRADVKRRQRKVLLSLPLYDRFAKKDFALASIEARFAYVGKSSRTVARDLADFMALRLLVQHEDGRYSVNLDVVMRSKRRGEVAPIPRTSVG